MNPDEHSKLVKNENIIPDNNKSMILKVKNSSNQIPTGTGNQITTGTGLLKKLVKTRIPSLPLSTSLTKAKPEKSSESLLKSQQNFREIVKKAKTRLFSCISCQTKFGSILNLIQHVVIMSLMFFAFWFIAISQKF